MANIHKLAPSLPTPFVLCSVAEGTRNDEANYNDDDKGFRSCKIRSVEEQLARARTKLERSQKALNANIVATVATMKPLFSGQPLVPYHHTIEKDLEWNRYMSVL